MAESVVKFLIDKLVPLIDNEVQLFSGVREEVVCLRGHLVNVRVLLRDADALEESDEELKVWIKQVRETAHEAEDILDEYKLLQPHEHHDGIYGALCRFSCSVKNLKAHYRIASKLRHTNGRFRSICEIQKRLHDKFRKVEQGSSSGCNAWRDRRGDALLLDKADIVGIEERKHRLVGWLVSGSSGREVVSVAGMGGLGKTTLAKQVYDDGEVKKHFKVRVWLTVSQPFNPGELLKDMVEQLYTIVKRRALEDAKGKAKDINWLRKAVKSLLQQKRYLIVLDDVWHLREWDFFKLSFPNNSLGSRVIITTRNSDVASTSVVQSDGQVYNLEPLPPTESWDLFCRKSFRGHSCPPYLEEVCKFILRKCEGLPLAIVAIGGVLATKDTRRIDEWDRIGHSLGAEIEGNDKLKDLKKVLSLSYNDLPYYLKSCFLYLSVFPENHLIEHMRLIRLWIAEGFIIAKEGKILEDVAEDYVNELMNRSLIQVATTTSDGRAKTFRIHDLLREILIPKSRDQNFATVSKGQSLLWSDKFRRLSIHNTLDDMKPNRSVSQLRSLFMFGVTEYLSIGRLFPYGFKLLNVLDLENGPLDIFPAELCNLYHLKFLSLRKTKVKSVPRLIGNLHNLETLDLKHSYVTELPVEILKLRKLRHLLLYRNEFISPYANFHSKTGFKVQVKIGSLSSLQKLCFIEGDQDGAFSIMTELGKLTQLRRLGITKYKREDGKALCLSLEKLTSLRALSIVSLEEDEIIDLEYLSSPPLLLQRLYLRGRLEILPHWISYLHGMVRLYLKWSRLHDDPLPLLEDLPNLVHLQLCQVFEGDTLCFRTNGFKKLKLLDLDTFDELTSIQLEVGTMPVIEKIVIQRCRLLEKVPSGIEHLTMLKMLEFSNMPWKLIGTLQADERESDYWKVSHIPEVYCTYWREGELEVYTLDGLFEGENSARLNTVIEAHELETRWK